MDGMLKKGFLIWGCVVIFLFSLIGIMAYYEKKNSQATLTQEAIDALNINDYKNAYSFIDKMKSQDYYNSNKQEIDQLNLRIVKNEIAEIMDEEEGNRAAGKIIFVLDERVPENDRADMINTAIKMANTIGDTILQKQLEDYRRTYFGR